MTRTDDEGRYEEKYEEVATKRDGYEELNTRK
jgi:hypothetical protein